MGVGCSTAALATAPLTTCPYDRSYGPIGNTEEVPLTGGIAPPCTGRLWRAERLRLDFTCTYGPGVVDNWCGLVNTSEECDPRG